MGMGNLKDKTTDREVGFGGAHQTRAPALKKEKKKTKTSQPSTANACVNDPKKGNTRTTTTHFLKGKERETTTGTAINQNKKIQKALREWLFLVHDITSRKVGSCHPFFFLFSATPQPCSSVLWFTRRITSVASSALLSGFPFQFSKCSKNTVVGK